MQFSNFNMTSIPEMSESQNSIQQLTLGQGPEFAPMKYEAKILVIRMMRHSYTPEEVVVVLGKLGFVVDSGTVEDVWTIQQGKEELEMRRKRNPPREPSMTLDHEKIMQMTYLFIHNQEMTVNKASELFRIRQQHLRRYLIQFGIGCTKAKVMKFDRYRFKGGGRKKMTEEEIQEIEEEEMNRLMNRPIIQEPSPIDPNSDPQWKKVEIRIIFPKIRYGQCHQWDRYYGRLTREVKLKSVQWIDFKQGDKFSGKGCYIYVLSKYDSNVYIDNFTLEKFLETSMPEDFFAGNCLSTNKIRVFDFPYIPAEMTEEEVINLKLPKDEIFEKVNKKIRQMVLAEQKQLSEVAARIHHQYTIDVFEQAKSRRKKARFSNFTKSNSLFANKPVKTDPSQFLKPFDQNNQNIDKNQLKIENANFDKNKYSDLVKQEQYPPPQFLQGTINPNIYQDGDDEDEGEGGDYYQDRNDKSMEFDESNSSDEDNGKQRNPNDYNFVKAEHFNYKQEPQE